MKDNFTAVESTMLIPLMIKANETKSKQPRIIDRKAVEIIEKLAIDDPNLDKFMSHEGVMARTILFDNAVKSYIDDNPNCSCINLACGLDDRFSRVDNGKITWYDLDLENVIKIRRQFFEETTRRKIISASMLDDNWVDAIADKQNAIIILEGVLMYFSKEQVKKAFQIIGNAFSNATIMAELMCKKATALSAKHDTVKHTGASFKWGVDHGNEIADMIENLELISETNFNVEMKKYSFRGWIFATLPIIKNMNNRLAVFKFNG